MLLDIARNDHTGNSKNLYLSLRRTHVHGAMQDIHDKYFVGAVILQECLIDQYYRANGCGHHLGAKRDYFCVSATDCPVFMGWNGSVTHKHVMRGWVTGISNHMDIGISAPCAAPPAPSLKAGSQTTSIRYAGVITTYAGSNVRVLAANAFAVSVYFACASSS